MSTNGRIETYEQEYEDRFAWRKQRQIANFEELGEITQSGVLDPMKAFPGLQRSSASDDPKDALRWSIFILWHETAECYIFGQFQSCILTCGAIVERCLKLEYQKVKGRLPKGRQTLAACVKLCEGIVNQDALDLATAIEKPKNVHAHALLEHSDPELSILGGEKRGIEIRSPHHYLIEPFRGDARDVIEITFAILSKLYGNASQAT